MLKFGTQPDSNMQNSVVMFNFALFDWNYPFGQIWSRKVHFFPFPPEISFLGKFGPKKSEVSIDLKFGTQTNSNMQGSMEVLTFFGYRAEIPFLVKFDPKIQKCQFKLKFGAQWNRNTQNSIVMFTFSVFDQKYSFWANLVKK